MADLPIDLVAAPNRLLRAEEAAAYLGIAVQTLQRMRRKNPTELPTVIVDKNRRRYRIADLDGFILSRRRNQREWINRKAFPSDDDDIPYALIGKLIGVTEKSAEKYIDVESNVSYRVAKMKDRKLPTVVAYMRHQWKRELISEIRWEYTSRIRSLQDEVKYYQKALAESKCKKCRKPKTVTPYNERLDPALRESIKQRLQGSSQ